MDDLITWLRAQLDDDERMAREATSPPWVHHVAPDPSGPDHTLLMASRVVSAGWYEDDALRPADAEHIARHDPARVLAEVDAKRRILDVYKADVIDVSVIPERPEWIHGRAPVEAHTVLRLLALPYADHPGYRDEWRP